MGVRKMNNISDFLKERLRSFNVPRNWITESDDFVYDDGGMYAAGDSFDNPTPKRIKSGKVYQEEVQGFDHIRAIAIATGLDWADVRKRYKAFEDSKERGYLRGIDTTINPPYRASVSVHAKNVKEFINDELGWNWIPTMAIGSGVTVHCRKEDLPRGNLILRCSKYYMASINGIIHDAFDNTRGGNRAVYGYWECDFFTPENYKTLIGEEI